MIFVFFTGRKSVQTKLFSCFYLLFFFFFSFLHLMEIRSDWRQSSSLPLRNSFWWLYWYSLLNKDVNPLKVTLTFKFYVSSVYRTSKEAENIRRHIWKEESVTQPHIIAIKKMQLFINIGVIAIMFTIKILDSVHLLIPVGRVMKKSNILV